MLTDPIVVPAAFPAPGNHARVSSEANKSTYRFVNGGKSYEYTIAHQYTKSKTRSVMRLNVTDIAADPLVPANSRNRTVSAYLVFDYEPGFSPATDVVNAFVQLCGLLGVNATVGNILTTTVTRIVNGEV